MKITNKIESYKLIKELKLNHLPERIFKAGQTENVINFMKEFPADFYAIRDKSKSGGIFKLKVSAQQVFEEIKGYSLFSINVSSANYVKNQKLVGEILIDGTNVNAVLSTNPEHSVRDALRNPTFNFVSTIFDNNLLDNVPCFDEVYKYIADHNLNGVIVEFAYFDKPVGLNNEQIILFEIRTDY